MHDVERDGVENITENIMAGRIATRGIHSKHRNVYTLSALTAVSEQLPTSSGAATARHEYELEKNMPVAANIYNKAALAMV
jgi:hypothetical protein